MQVFVFDLLPYRVHLDDLERGKELPYPLGKKYFEPAEAVKTYAEHLDAWEEMTGIKATVETYEVVFSEIPSGARQT